MMMFGGEWVVWGGVEVRPAGSHWEDVTGDMTEEKEDMTTKKITSFLVRIIFLSKEIGACERNLFVLIQIILLLKDLIPMYTN
jgi:hypothetical protein